MHPSNYTNINAVTPPHHSRHVIQADRHIMVKFSHCLWILAKSVAAPQAPCWVADVHHVPSLHHANIMFQVVEIDWIQFLTSGKVRFLKEVRIWPGWPPPVTSASCIYSGTTTTSSLPPSTLNSLAHNVQLHTSRAHGPFIPAGGSSHS